MVEAGGIRHVAGLPWDADGVVDVEGSTITGAACAGRLGAAVAAGGSGRHTVLRVTAGLLITTGPGVVERLDDETWRIAGGTPVRADRSGLPVMLDAVSWPLERLE